MRELRDRELMTLSDEEFVSAWKALLGEPPAILVDRPIMVELLLDSIVPELGNRSGPAPSGGTRAAA
jgi:hypothetical protein